jgi:outer membrane protein
MNKLATYIFILCSLILNASIASADGQLVGVVDMQKCIQTSSAGKRARAELEGAFNKKKKELQDQEASLKKQQEEFVKKAAALSDAAKKEQQAKFQEKVMKYQELVQKSQADIQKKEQEMSEPIIRKIREKVSEIARKKSFGLVLEKNDNIVIYTDGKTDITEDVLKALD